MSGPGFTSLRVGFEALRNNPLRTALSTSGVVIGVAALVAVLSVGDGVERFARQQIASTTDLQAVMVTPLVSREVDGVHVPTPAAPRLGLADVRDFATAVPAEARVELISSGGGLVREPGEGGRPRGVVVTARAGPPDTRPLLAGRAIGAEESASVDPVVVINHSLAEMLAAPAAATSVLGDSVTIGEARVVIVGILAPTPAPVFAAVVPFALGERAMSPSAAPRPASLLAIAPTVEAVAPLRERVEAWVAGHDSTWRQGIAVRSQQARLAQALQGALIFKILMGTVAGVSLLVGGIGIMNVLLAAVAERTREVGLRKAAGARRRDVLLQFLAESVAITSVGSAIGVGLGFALAAGGTAVMRARAGAPVEAGASWSTVAVSAGAAIVIGLVFGMYPAMRAARLDPIDAIRHE